MHRILYAVLKMIEKNKYKEREKDKKINIYIYIYIYIYIDVERAFFFLNLFYSI